MQNVMIYPYDLEAAPLLRHRSLLKMNIVKVVSPNGWGFAGKDAGMVDGGSDTDLTVETSFENAATECDTILLVDSIASLDFDRYIYPKINLVTNKTILCNRQLNDQQKERLKSSCDKNNNNLIMYDSEGLSKPFENISTAIYKYLSIKTPVVFIMGWGERTDKFEIQLALREQLMNMGYRVSQIGSRKGCELLGFHSIPDFMTATNLTESEKITSYNYYLKQIETQENPEIILIGIPGGMMPITNKFTNYFGVLTYEIFQAVKPDYIVFSSIFEKSQPSYFSELSNLVQRKYDSPIDFHVIAHNKIDWPATKNGIHLSYLSLDSKCISREIDQLSAANQPIINIFSESGPNVLAKNVIDKLTAYSAENDMLKLM